MCSYEHVLNPDQRDMCDDRLYKRYQIEDCSHWIQSHGFQRLTLQFDPNDLQDSTSIVEELSRKNSDCEFYVVVTASCGVDFLSPLRLGADYIQAVILFGSKNGSPCLTTGTSFGLLPVLFVSGERFDDESYEVALRMVKDVEKNNEIVFYDVHLAPLVTKLISEKVLQSQNVAKIVKSCDQWSFSSNISSLIDEESSEGRRVGHFKVPINADEHKSAIWFGKCENLFFRTTGWNMRGFDPESRTEWSCVPQKELTKRLAVIERAKSAQTIGVVFTHTLPSTDLILSRLNDLLAKRGKKSVLISILQSADETKFGNFPEVDAYVVCSDCQCGSLILRTKAHVPLISLNELDVAIGVKTMFGGLCWNSDSVDEDEGLEGDPAGNSIREIMEFKGSMRSNWYGLQVAAGEHEPVVAEEGLSGVASAYASEPRPD